MHRHAQGARARFKMGLLCGVAAAVIATQAVAADKPVAFNIAAQEAGPALNEFSRQSGLAVLFPFDAVEGKRTPAISGTMGADEALKVLLDSTGLVLVSRSGDTVALAQAGEGGSGPQAASADGDVDALIVTAQKKEENIQDVPIAISVFTQKTLDAQKLEGGFDLLKAIPNVTFSKTNFSGYNFSIRGIGTQAVSATTDPGVAVSMNNTTLIVNRLFEQEYVDMERVEVLRGPQGTLYGRNATAGVINVITAKPIMGEFEGELKLETGNFAAQRLRAMINVPVGDEIAVRGAFAMTQRDGYGYNEASETNATRTFGDQVRPDVDGRDLWTGRITVGWEPTENFRANLLWERFSEDDNRVRTSKQLCHHDEGARLPVNSPYLTPETYESLVDQGFITPDGFINTNNYINSALTQACKPGSLYEEGAFGTPNGASLPYVSALFHVVDQAQGFLASFTGEIDEAFGLGYNPWNRSLWANPNTPPPGLPCGELNFTLVGGTTGGHALDICNPDVYGGLQQRG